MLLEINSLRQLSLYALNKYNFQENKKYNNDNITLTTN